MNRLETREPLLLEAADALGVIESVNLDGFLGWGRTVKLTPEAREALIRACEVEIEELRSAVDEAKRSLRKAYEQELG